MRNIPSGNIASDWRSYAKTGAPRNAWISAHIATTYERANRKYAINSPYKLPMAPAICIVRGKVILCKDVKGNNNRSHCLNRPLPYIVKLAHA